MEGRDDTHYLGDGRSIKVLPGKVLVHFEKPEEKTVGGLIIPTSAQNHLGNAEILAFGEIRKKRGVAKLGVTKGDRVLVMRALAAQGSNPRLQSSFEDDLAIIEPDDIIGVLE